MFEQNMTRLFAYRRLLLVGEAGQRRAGQSQKTSNLLNHLEGCLAEEN